MLFYILEHLDTGYFLFNFPLTIEFDSFSMKRKEFTEISYRTLM